MVVPARRVFAAANHLGTGHRRARLYCSARPGCRATLVSDGLRHLRRPVRRAARTNHRRRVRGCATWHVRVGDAVAGQWLIRLSLDAVRRSASAVPQAAAPSAPAVAARLRRSAAPSLAADPSGGTFGLAPPMFGFAIGMFSGWSSSSSAVRFGVICGRGERGGGAAAATAAGGRAGRQDHDAIVDGRARGPPIGLGAAMYPPSSGAVCRAPAARERRPAGASRAGRRPSRR